MSDPRFAELLEKYWAVAYQQGAEGRNYDDANGTAEYAEIMLHQYVDRLTHERDTLADDTVSLLRHLADIRMKSGVGDKPMLHELASAISDRISGLTRELAEAREALDEKEIASGLTSDGNLWRYWAAKAKDLALKNAALERALKEKA